MSNAVSFSRANTYKKCPACYEWQYILGHKGEFNPGPAALRGTRIHNSIEDFHNGVGSLDEEIPMQMAEYLNRYMGEVGWNAYPEMKWGFTSDWLPCDFEAEEGYVRGMMDGVWVKTNDVCPVEVVIDEYKTGKEYPEHADQKQMYAMAALLTYPTIDSVVVNGVYLDLKKIKRTEYSRMHLGTMQYTWDRQIAKMKLPIYPARPGFHCRYCPKSNSKGGPCRVG